MKSLGFFITLIFLAGTLHLSGQADIRINEFLTNNQTINYDPDFYTFSDWIELRNNEDHAIDLKGYTVVYESDVKYNWIFKSATQIEAGGYLIIWADESNTKDKALHTNFTLQREGGKISLLNLGKDTVHSVQYGQQEVDISFGLDASQNDEWLYYAYPSPKSSNILPAFTSPDRLSRPDFSIEGGTYNQSQVLSLSSNSELARIYFTTDGSKPTLQSTEYTGPINIPTTKVVRAIAFDNSAHPSRTTTHSYLINEGITLPIMSIAIDHDHFWDDEIGFYVEGSNGLTGWESGYGPSPKSNFNQNWRRPVNMEFYDEQHQPGFSIEGDIKVYGGWSRGAVIKSFAVYPEENINYQLFKEKPFTNYESFIIRNSGNDWPSTKIRDAALQSLAINHLDVDLQANRPTVLFINGEFWGVLNIREKINEDYTFTNHGVNQDSVDFLERYVVVKSGDRRHYLKMMEYISTHSLANQDNYKHFKTLVDVEECMNYFITGIYSGHGDWIYNGNNNLRLWRPKREDGRWRWLLYDTDGVFQSSSGRGIAEAMGRSEILTKILENQEAKNYFINTFTALLNNAFAPGRAVHMIDSLKSLIEPDVTRHIAKWKNTNDDGSTADWKNPDSERYLQVDDGYMGPSLASFDQWNSKFGGARSVAEQRPGWLLNEIKTLFSQGDLTELRFRLSEANRGIILVNNIEVLDYHGSSTFFNGQTLEFEALPQFGCKFNHWEVGSYSTNTTIQVGKNSQWKYLDDGSDQGSAWRFPVYNDDAWKTGEAELGYGDGGETTLLGYGGDASNKYTTYYFRKQFNIDDADQFDGISINIMRDDGVVIYLNGSEIVRDNMPGGDVDYLTFASTAVSNTDESNYFSFQVPSGALQSGENTIAVELHQISLSSSDVSFDLELKSVQTSPVNNEVINDKKFSKAIQGDILIKAVFDSTSFEKTLFINELMAENENFSWPSEIEQGRDWIEIYNSGKNDLNLAGMYISDDITNPGLYRIPYTDLHKTNVPSGGYRILYADGMPELGSDHLIFKLDKKSEEIALAGKFAKKIVILDSISFEPQIMDVSFGRMPDGFENTMYMTIPSPLSSNRNSYVDEVFGLYINEIMPVNEGLISDNYGEFEDWIEIYNANDFPVSMAGLFLSDDFSNPTKWRIPSQYGEKTTIPAGGYLLYWADEDTEQGVNHLNFKLSPLKEQLGLYQLMGQEIILIDTLSYSLDKRNISFGRYPDSDESLFVFDYPTPGTANKIKVSTDLIHYGFGFKVYPNPSTGIFFLEPENTEPENEEISTIEIYGVAGELLRSISVAMEPASKKAYMLNLSDIPPGMYFIKYTYHEATATKKIFISD